MVESKDRYRISRENLLAHELNGLKARVVESSSPERIGKKGVIVKETRNVFVLEQENGKEVVLPKKEVVLEFEIGKERVKVNGKDLCFKPEERTKRCR